jgi:hypothetical protein
MFAATGSTYELLRREDPRCPHEEVLMASPLLNWIDTMFFGVRRILSGGVELPERPALNFEGATVTDNPAKNRIDVTFSGLQPDGSGGFVIGSRTGGWVTVKPGDQGFRVSSNNGKTFAFVVDNGAAEVRVGYALQVASVVRLGDVREPVAPERGVTLASVEGTLRGAQQAPPTVTGSRGGNAALASLLQAPASGDADPRAERLPVASSPPLLYIGV